MDVNQLIKCMSNQNKYIHTKFYTKCIEKLEAYKLESGNQIEKIPENKYILESIRVFLLHKEYFIYIADRSLLATFKNNICYRILELSPKSVNNLLHQIYAIEDNIVKLICEKIPYQIDNPCFVISQEALEIKNDKCISISGEKKYDITNLMLGVESLKILEHQDLNRFCNFVISEKPEVKKSINMFSQFYQFYEKLDLVTKERLILFSGAILHSLGTTYTADIDLIYYGEGESKEKIDRLLNTFKKNDNYDYSIIYDKTILARRPSGYLYKWLYEKWPNLVDKENMVEVMADPKYHFHFLGIKMVGVKMIVERLLARASPSAFVDLLMLNKINGYKSSPCFPNLSLRQGQIKVYNDQEINKTLNTVKNYFKYWHGIDTTIDTLKKEIVKCNELPHNIYSKKTEPFKYSSEITRYHNMFAKNYINKYFRKSKLLDIGAGPLRQIDYYKEIGISKLVAIEPSEYSIEEGIKNMKKRNIDINIDIINGYGDELWELNDKYKDVIDNKPYKSILFKFTIHYMLKNIDNVLQNIKNVNTDNTTIMITCLDGNKINEKLRQHNGRYEIIFGEEPLYGIYDMNRTENGLQQIMIYFRGVYGVENGSIEYLVDIDWLIAKFESIGYKVVENKSFLDTSDPHLIRLRDKLNNTQKKVSELHKILILSKNEFSNKVAGYYNLYLKYKKKYINTKKMKNK